MRMTPIHKRILTIVLIVTTYTLFSQEADLGEYTWYVHSTTIDGTTTEAPFNGEMKINAELTPSFDEITFYESDLCCGGMLAMELDFDTATSTFEIVDSSVTSANCEETENNDYRDVYVDFFQDNIGDEFDYQITTDSGYLSLMLTNAAGDELHFYNTLHGLTEDDLYFEDNSDYPYWYLQSTDIADDSFDISSLDLSSPITGSFYTDGYFEIEVCGTVSGYMAFDSGKSHIICNALDENTYGCPDPEIKDLKDAIQNFFLENGHELEYYRSHTDPDGTEFLVICTPNGEECLYFTDNYTLSTHNPERFNIAIYPNPVKNTLYIKDRQGQVKKASLYDLQGRLLKTVTVESKIDVHDLPAGLYLIELTGEYGTVQKKFVKE